MKVEVIQLLERTSNKKKLNLMNNNKTTDKIIIKI